MTEAEARARRRRTLEAHRFRETHKLTETDLTETHDRIKELKAKLGRPPTLAEVADCFPTRKDRKGAK